MTSKEIDLLPNFTIENNTDSQIEELVLLNHELTQKEHNTLVHALKSFLNSTLTYMTHTSTKIAINTLKKQKEIARELLSTMYAFSNEIVVSNQEFSILKNALKNYVHLPKPLWRSPEEIKEIKEYQDIAVHLLDTLKLD